jgi:hypothetical protein
MSKIEFCTLCDRWIKIPDDVVELSKTGNRITIRDDNDGGRIHVLAVGMGKKAALKKHPNIRPRVITETTTAVLPEPPTQETSQQQQPVVLEPVVHVPEGIDEHNWHEVIPRDETIGVPEVDPNDWSEAIERSGRKTSNLFVWLRIRRKPSRSS